ncbi:hypothetical protein DVK03_15030 [Haloferax sp. Atlit-109R]|nr:hypothetical protein DVK03_15030 [Haloferax sp. Atlit-109R]
MGHERGEERRGEERRGEERRREERRGEEKREQNNEVMADGRRRRPGGTLSSCRRRSFRWCRSRDRRRPARATSRTRSA